MSLTPTTPIPLGFTAPDFNLPDVTSEQNIRLSDLKGEHGLVVMFICNHCPYVIHVREEMVKIAKDYQSKGIGFVAISSNDVENYPEDGPTYMKAFAHELSFSFPYLYDATQEVAKAYHAACTPDFSVFDADLSCVYRGRMDGSTPGNRVPVTGEDLRNVLDNIVSGNEITKEQLPSMGCNIKWKSQ